MKYLSLFLLLFVLQSCQENTIIYSKHSRFEYYYMIGSKKHSDTIKELRRNYIDSSMIYYYKTNKGIQYIDEITYNYYSNN